MTDIKYLRGGGSQVTGKGGRFYTWQGDRFESVTSIISGGLPKPALINWAKKYVANFAVDNLELLVAMVENDPAGAVDWLKESPYRDRDKAADLGSLVHNVAEAYVLEKDTVRPPSAEWSGLPLTELPQAARGRISAFYQFIDEVRPKFLASELTVFNREQRYAGTLDAIVDTDSHGRLLIDYKTGKGVYPEVALQLSAYRYAEFYGLPDGSEHPVYEVDGCAVLHLTDGGYWLLPVATNTDIFTDFLYVREVFRFTRLTAKQMIGTPLAEGRNDADS